MSPPCKLLAGLGFLLSLAHVGGAQESAALRGASAAQPSQVLVFDAGSSGTRIHVFNVFPGAEGSLAPRIDLAVRDQQTKKIKPGLSSFAERSDLDGVEANIKQLLEFASQWVPADRRSSTPALLKATAGLRAVKPAKKAEAILERVRATLAKSGYLFKMEWADIIKGKEEAGLAWVAANYLQGKFLKPSSAAAPSLGVIEMGGGSTQVSYEVGISEAPGLVESDSFVFNTLAGTSHILYAHSYLGYGMDHAQAKMRSFMQEDEAADPCYPTGYLRQPEKGYPVPGEPTLLTPEEVNKHMEDGTEPTGAIKGSGNAESCLELVKSRLLAPSETDAPGRYSKEVALHGKIIATENFFYVRDSLKLPLDGSISAMREAARTACEAPLNPSKEQEAAMRAGTADSFKQKECFGLSYQVALIEAFTKPGEPASGGEPVQVQIARQINGGDIDWALGAALVHFINSFIAEKAEAAALQEPYVATESSSMATVGLVLFLLVAALGAARFFMGPRFSKQVTAISSDIVASTIGSRRWISTDKKSPVGSDSESGPLD